MKKSLVAAFVGGLIIFIWQFLSFAAVNLHEPAQQYTDKQDAILETLSSQGLAEGGYIMPMPPPGVSMEEHEKYMEPRMGQPWVQVQYHKALENDMVMNMVRGLIVNMIIIFLFCQLVARMKAPRFSTIFVSALTVGFIVFLNVPYTNHIWFETFDIWAHLLDAVVSWGLAGLFLGWYLSRHVSRQEPVRIKEKFEMAE